MHGSSISTSRRLLGVAFVLLTAVIVAVIGAAAANNGSAAVTPGARTVGSPPPTWTQDVAHDVSAPLWQLARDRIAPDAEDPADEQDRGPTADGDTGFTGDGAVQTTLAPPTIPSTDQNFEGLSNQDNFNIFGFRVNPPDPNGEVGPNNYVEMINLVFGVYDKAGNLLVGPVDTGTLWSGFAVPDCTEPSGDPVVLYDQFMDRWILSQFTTSGLDDPSKPFWNCVAVSTTSDPTGSYYRYAFETGHFQYFPDYPKYGNWTDSYVLTTREFGPTVEYGIGVYALEKNKMVNGQDRPGRSTSSSTATTRTCSRWSVTGCCRLTSMASRSRRPTPQIPLVGTQDDGSGYGGTFDALNIFNLSVKWKATPEASLMLGTQLPRSRSTRSSRARRRLATACRNLASSTRRSTSTSSRTVSGRRSGWLTETSRRTSRW